MALDINAHRVAREKNVVLYLITLIYFAIDAAKEWLVLIKPKIDKVIVIKG